MQQTMGRRFNGLLQYLGEAGQNRMIEAANKFLELAEKKAVPVYRCEDGTHTLTNPQEKPKESTSK
jgi:hypothetical protein